jgi:hypothetical protein
MVDGLDDVDVTVGEVVAPRRRRGTAPRPQMSVVQRSHHQLTSSSNMRSTTTCSRPGDGRGLGRSRRRGEVRVRIFRPRTWSQDRFMVIGTASPRSLQVCRSSASWWSPGSTHRRAFSQAPRGRARSASTTLWYPPRQVGVHRWSAKDRGRPLTFSVGGLLQVGSAKLHDLAR